MIPVPAYAEKSQTTAYYFPGATESGRPGYFFANTYALETRPKGERPTLEAINAALGGFSSASDGTGDTSGDPKRERRGRRG